MNNNHFQPNPIEHRPLTEEDITKSLYVPRTVCVKQASDSSAADEYFIVSNNIFIILLLIWNGNDIRMVAAAAASSSLWIFFRIKCNMLVRVDR